MDRNVEAAIQTLPRSTEPTPELAQTGFPHKADRTATLSVADRPHSPGPSAGSSPRPRTPISATTAGGRQETESAADLHPNVSFPDATKAWFQRTGDLVERGVSKPLNAIARIVDDLAGDNLREGGDERDQALLAYQQLQSQLQSSQQQQPPPPQMPTSSSQYPGASAGAPLSPPRSIDRRTSTTSLNSRRRGTRTWSVQPFDPALAAAQASPSSASRLPGDSSRPSRSRQTSHLSTTTATATMTAPTTPLSHPDHAAAYVPDSVDPAAVAAEMERRDRAHRQRHAANIETLRSIFPHMEMEVLEILLVTNDGQLPKTIDTLLEMSAPS